MVAISSSGICFWNNEEMVLEKVLTVRGFDVPSCCSLVRTTISFSSNGRVFEVLKSGISATVFDRAAKTFLSLRCWIKGSKPVSLEMTWKNAVGSATASCPM